MVNDPSSFNVGQAGEGEAVMLLLALDPGRQRLFDDPCAGAVKLLR